MYLANNNRYSICIDSKKTYSNFPCTKICILKKLITLKKFMLEYKKMFFIQMYLLVSFFYLFQNGGTNRRYEYVEYENGRILGRKQGCSRGTVKVDSWWRWLFWHCSYCFCYCDEEGPNSDRYINMRAAIADLDNNMVVTGLRFIKQNRIIHLQIQVRGKFCFVN